MIQKKYLDLEGLSSYTTKIKNYVASLLTKYAPMDNSAGAWNGIYHRKNLLDEFSLDELSSKIASGDFSGIPIGSYIETDIKPSVDGAVLALSGNSTSGTTAYDISGNANNATMSNVTLSSDTDKAFVCNTDNERIYGNISLSNDFTIRLSVNPSLMSSRYLFNLTDSSNNSVVYYATNEFNYNGYKITMPLNLNTDNDIALALDFTNNKMKAYIGGVLFSEISIAKSSFSIAKFCFGNSIDSGTWGFHGTMKGIKIYPRALSADEILQLHNATQDEGLTERVRPLVAGLDHCLHSGSTPIEDHHLVMVFEDCLKNTAKMNATNTATGGFNGAYLRLAVLPSLLKTLRINLDTSHILTYNALFSTSVSDTSPSMAGAGFTGASNSWGWAPIGVSLMNEVELYGTTVLSSSFFDVGISKTQFPLFKQAPELIQCGRGINGSTASRFAFWLRSVASSTRFCDCTSGGAAVHSNASDSIGVRPYFLFK